MQLPAIDIINFSTIWLNISKIPTKQIDYREITQNYLKEQFISQRENKGEKYLLSSPARYKVGNLKKVVWYNLHAARFLG